MLYFQNNKKVFWKENWVNCLYSYTDVFLLT